MLLLTLASFLCALASPPRLLAQQEGAEPPLHAPLHNDRSSSSSIKEDWRVRLAFKRLPAVPGASASATTNALTITPVGGSPQLNSDYTLTEWYGVNQSTDYYFLIDSTTGPASFYAFPSKQGNIGEDFVSVTPSPGTTPATVRVRVNTANLTGGTHTESVAFVLSGTQQYVGFTVTAYIESPFNASSRVGIFRPASSLFLLDSNADGVCCSGDVIGSIGQVGDIALSGDWAGTGRKRFGLYRPATGQFVLDVNGNGTLDAGDLVLTFPPQAGDVPVVGSWTGSGADRVGVFRGGTWYLDQAGDGTFSGRSYLGQTGDIPLTGAWSGGRQSCAGIYRPFSSLTPNTAANFFLLDANCDGVYTSADPPLFYFGQAGDVPIVGDWSGDGRDKVGLFRPATGLFLLDRNGSNTWDGPGVDRALFFQPYVNGLSATTTAQPGDIPVTGNWARSYGADTTANIPGPYRVGLFRPSAGTFYLDISADGTFQARAFLGQAGDMVVGVPVIQNGQVIGASQLGWY